MILVFFVVKKLFQFIHKNGIEIKNRLFVANERIYVLKKCFFGSKLVDGENRGSKVGRVAS